MSYTAHKSGTAEFGSWGAGKFGHRLRVERTVFSCGCVDLLRYIVIDVTGSFSLA